MEKDTQNQHFCGGLESKHLALDLLVEAVGAHDDAADGETLVDTGHFVFPIKVYRHQLTNSTDVRHGPEEHAPTATRHLPQHANGDDLDDDDGRRIGHAVAAAKQVAVDTSSSIVIAAAAAMSCLPAFDADSRRRWRRKRSRLRPDADPKRAARLAGNC